MKIGDPPSSCCDSFMTPFCYKFLISHAKDNSSLEKNLISIPLWLLGSLLSEDSKDKPENDPKISLSVV